VDRASSPFWCVSVNPAIDKRMHVSTLMPGRVNRVSDVRAEPGGKAAHVAMVLRTLGTDPLWLGFAGGSTGDQLLNGLRELNIRVHPVMVHAETRVNLEIIDDHGGVTELLEPGSPIAQKDWANLFEVCEKMLSQEKMPGTVIASGSLPPSAEPGFYAKLTELTHNYGHKMILDTGGEPMRLALSAAPDFIKPNREEAESLTSEKITDCEAAKNAVNRLIQLGARSAVVSLGRQGFVWQPGSGQDAYLAHPVSVKVKSGVGCGDATVAAFAYAMSTGFGAEKTLQLAAACGAANCLADAPGRLRESDVRALEAQVRIEKLA
jgi:1-phosphofructokinase family hexose kinase